MGDGVSSSGVSKVVRIRRHAWRLGVLVVVAWLALQVNFVGRVALMRWVDPESTAFQRSEVVRLIEDTGTLRWSHEWRPYDEINLSLKRAVIASEDAGFTDHNGVEWDAIEKAWERNQRAEALAAKANEAQEKRLAKAVRSGKAPFASAPAPAPKVARIVGGSTISQQLAKNLFLSGERTAIRKGQEFLITYMLEGLLDKQRIYEIYLNNVEWGAGVFGAEAAAGHYFRTDAARLAPAQAARLAVMLPAPKRFELRPGSSYLSGRASTVMARMAAVDLP